MKKEKLCLSHWDSKEEIFVPHDIAKLLKPFQCTAVRFLYNCYQKNVSFASQQNKNNGDNCTNYK